MKKKLQNFARSYGYDEGAEDKTLEIAKNFLSLNVSIEDISKATGLSIEEIENL